MITSEQVKELRDATGISIMQCRKALEEANGDMEKAATILKKKGADIAAKKADRTLGAGRIAAYIHGSGNTAAMVELSCETDFVAKNEEFLALAYDIAMQIVATDPKYLKAEDITAEEREKMKEVFMTEVDASKPEAIKEKIITGKLDAYFNEQILLEQPFIKNGDVKIKDLIQDAIQKFGEKTEIRRFVRYSSKAKTTC
ncbi:MAG: translation elongation factor Ts [Minisyncoccia bacterium]